MSILLSKVYRPFVLHLASIIKNLHEFSVFLLVLHTQVPRYQQPPCQLLEVRVFFIESFGKTFLILTQKLPPSPQIQTQTCPECS
jgi:hypothetical protein